jgi:hypothetical protein
MKEFGSVQIPQETFIDVLKTDADGWSTGTKKTNLDFTVK